MSKFRYIIGLLLLALMGWLGWLLYISPPKPMVIKNDTPPKVHYSYLADKEALWKMLSLNYGIKKNQDRYAAFREVEEAERELGVKNCDLLAIATKESRLNQFVRGDHGHSLGLFQINTYYNPDVTERQAFMAKSSAEWTYKNLVKNGYPTRRVYAIARHNGSINRMSTQAYAYRVLLAAERICSFR